jgi:small GTP-binding protein
MIPAIPVFNRISGTKLSPVSVTVGMRGPVPQLKLVLLGDESVGKTCLLNKWTSNLFDSTSSPTIGGAAQTKRDQIDGTTYCFQIWDTAGAERYRALTPLYARDAKAALLVYDITRRSSFESIPGWITFLRQQGEIPFVIVGNKDDLSAEAKVASEEGTLLAQAHDSIFFQASAKNGSNVELAFRQAEIYAANWHRKSRGPQTTLLLDADRGPRTERCC